MIVNPLPTKLTLYLLITTIAFFILFYWLITIIKLQLLEMKNGFQNQDLHMFGIKFNNFSTTCRDSHLLKMNKKQVKCLDASWAKSLLSI